MILISSRRSTFDLFLISALSLFLELIFIRWLASELRIVAFYKNFALIATFLGLGLGFASRSNVQKQNWFERFFFPLLVISVSLVLLLSNTLISEAILSNRANTQEFIWAGYLASTNPLIQAFLDAAFYAILLILFLLITLLFIPLGQLTARKFSSFSPLRGYTINIIGSLVGILLYSLISFLGQPPEVWFFITALTALYFIPRDNKTRFVFNAVLAGLPVLYAIFIPTGADLTLWSPYYRIDINAQPAPENQEINLGYELSVNRAWHQRIWNLDPNFIIENYNSAPEHFDSKLVEYDLPFTVAPALDKILIVGAGTGNDVAAARRAGADNIIAVEIDPLMFRIGEDLHPESPYEDKEKVTQINQDARSFFRQEGDKFDLIVFGRLDSHTLFSTASSVRLDNFVYTQESLAEVKKLLAEGGLLALSFGVPRENEWVGLRIYRVLTDVFGHSPQVYAFPNDNIIFLIGHQPFSQQLVNDPLATPRYDYAYRQDIPSISDNWPYLYLQQRTIPTTYLITLAGIIVLSLILTRVSLPAFRNLNVHFFFMGAAFFLLETKSITEIALLFGSTWLVNAAVIASILMMITIANIIVSRLRLTNAIPFYTFLVIALVFNFIFPISNFLGLPFAGRIILSSISLALPLFFAAMIFAITFSQTTSIDSALGSNMLGAVFGGIFEYASLMLGIRSLYVFALIFYIISALPLLKPRLTGKREAIKL
jgi:hypothetical protein